MPEDAPRITRRECEVTGANLELVDGLIGDAGKIVGEAVRTGDWFDASTLKEPYRLEGKKTLGLEIAEQLAGASRRDHLPDRRRRRDHRHLQGPARAAGAWLDQRRQAPASGLRAGGRVRADRARVRGAGGELRGLAGREHRRLWDHGSQGARRFPSCCGRSTRPVAVRSRSTTRRCWPASATSRTPRARSSVLRARHGGAARSSAPRAGLARTTRSSCSTRALGSSNPDAVSAVAVGAAPSPDQDLPA